MVYRQSIHVEAPVEKVFGFFKDPSNWRSVEPKGVERVRHPRRSGPGCY